MHYMVLSIFAFVNLCASFRKSSFYDKSGLWPPHPNYEHMNNRPSHAQCHWFRKALHSAGFEHAADLASVFFHPSNFINMLTGTRTGSIQWLVVAYHVKRRLLSTGHHFQSFSRRCFLSLTSKMKSAHQPWLLVAGIGSQRVYTAKRVPCFLLMVWVGCLIWPFCKNLGVHGCVPEPIISDIRDAICPQASTTSNLECSSGVWVCQHSWSKKCFTFLRKRGTKKGDIFFFAFGWTFAWVDLTDYRPETYFMTKYIIV